MAESAQIIEKEEEIIAQLAQRHWGRSSEKHPGQSELSLFNEAELAAMQAPLDEDEAGGSNANEDLSPDSGGKDPDTQPAPPKSRKARKRLVLPAHLERVRLVHELDEEHRQLPCGGTWVRIGEELSEQISVIPARQFVIQHIKVKYACSCSVQQTSTPRDAFPRSVLIDIKQLIPCSVHRYVSYLIQRVMLVRVTNSNFLKSFLRWSV